MCQGVQKWCGVGWYGEVIWLIDLVWRFGVGRQNVIQVMVYGVVQCGEIKRGDEWCDVV